MSAGVIQTLLDEEYNIRNETVLIESCFNETTRKGSWLRTVIIGLTTRHLVVASKRNFEDGKSGKKLLSPYMCDIDLQYLYPLETLKLVVYKKSKRKSIKTCFNNADKVKYFDLGYTEKNKKLWRLWCRYVTHLSTGFIDSKVLVKNLSSNDLLEVWKRRSSQECWESAQVKTGTRWTNKRLFLGSIREKEDSNRPVPVPGIGNTKEDIISYLGYDVIDILDSVAESEVQTKRTESYDCYTYREEPTTPKVTYTSIIATANSGSRPEDLNLNYLKSFLKTNWIAWQ